MAQNNTGDWESGDKVSHEVKAGLDAPGDVKMEASILSDDVMRAGGFGAIDDISSFLPVASDSTDPEASVRDAREYGDPQEEICRPGLGWAEATKKYKGHVCTLPQQNWGRSTEELQHLGSPGIQLHLLIPDITLKLIQTPNKETSRGKKIVESAEREANMKDDPKQRIGPHIAQNDTSDLESGDKVSHEVKAGLDASADVNMEASISSDDVMRAGGFGARDDISSFLPVASDSTDFEASLRDAREYEDPQEKICRPGLGWAEATKKD